MARTADDVTARSSRARSDRSVGAGGATASSKVVALNGAASAWTPAAGEVGIRVRMYRVGFGDFFLLSFLDATGTARHAVIDCGVFKGTSQTGDLQSIDAAVANLVQTTGGRVALIVMTHRHADHIAGFARCGEAFRNLAVEAVWMPIWESEYEPTAVKFQAELTRTAVALRQQLAALGAGATGEQITARKYMENATGELGIGGRSSNAIALDLLKHGFAGVTPRYHARGDKAQLPKALADAGLSIEILGPPPLRDLDLMKLMDLQKNVGQYLAKISDVATDPLDPFGAEWEVKDPETGQGDREAYVAESFREWVMPKRKYWESLTAGEGVQARGRMEAALERALPSATLTAAKQLNGFLNNQSLVLLLTFKGKKLLFAGDAQAGNWEHWLFGTDTRQKEREGQLVPNARQILTSLDFYKVGHHGSSNATPRVAAETMGTNAHRFAAMCSTEAGVYGTEDPDDPAKGTEVPRGPLLQALAEKSAFVRSDQIPITVDGKDIPASAPAPLPARSSGFRFKQGALWIDCYL